MGKVEDFRTQLARLVDEAATHPDRFGAGARLLFSCRSNNLPSDLAAAEAQGVDARGVGRMHILVEVGDQVPDAEWIATHGAAIAKYFESIGGGKPQVTVDRGPTDAEA